MTHTHSLSLTDLYTYTHSLAHSLTHLLTYSLTHTLTRLDKAYAGASQTCAYVGGTFNNVLTHVANLNDPEGEQQDTGIQNTVPSNLAQSAFVAKTAGDVDDNVNVNVKYVNANAVCGYMLRAVLLVLRCIVFIEP